jgi:hypothetical protein
MGEAFGFYFLCAVCGMVLGMYLSLSYKTTTKRKKGKKEE